MKRPLCCLVTMMMLTGTIACISATDVPPLKPVEVISDPAEIEAAKTAEVSADATSARAVGWAIRGLLDSDYLPGLYSFEQHRASAVPRLKKLIELAGDTPAPASIAASHLLHQLGEPGYEPQIAAALTSNSAALRRMGLQLIQSDGDFDKPLGPAVAAKVLSLIDDRDPKVRLAATNVAGGREVPGFGAKLQSAVRAGRIAAEDVSHWLAAFSDDPTMFDRVADALFADLVNRVEAGEGWVYAGNLTAFTENPNAKVAQHARTRLRQMIRKLKPEHRHTFAFSNMLEKVATSADADLLHNVLQHAPEQAAREAALRGLARIQPDQAAALALKTFGRAPHAATTVLAEHATEMDAAQFIKAVAALDSADWSMPMIDLLMDKGGEAGRQLVRERLDGLDSYLKTAGKWRLEGLSLATAIREFHEAGIISASSEELMKPAEQRTDADIEEGYIDPPMSLEEALEQAGVLMWWDAESGQLPAGHNALLAMMGGYSNDYFRPKYVSETWLQRNGNDPRAPYRVQFIHDDKLIRFEARNYGDWYDLEAVVAAANRALEVTGRPERFTPLNSGDQTAMLLFADPKVFEPLAVKYGLQLDASADGARQRGLEFEAKALNQIDVKEME